MSAEMEFGGSEEWKEIVLAFYRAAKPRILYFGPSLMHEKPHIRCSPLTKSINEVFLILYLLVLAR